MRPPRIYRYILRHDDGYAPCIDNGLLTLATCKPAIRSTADIGDWVAGYMPKGLGEGLLVWFAQVEKVMRPTDYERNYRGRRDAQYRMNASGDIERVNPRYHPDRDQQHRDKRAKVLIFDPAATWYFGGEPVEPPSSLGFLKPEGQGHRVKVREPGDLEAMLICLNEEGPPGLFARPRSDEDDDCGTGCAPSPKRRLKRC